MMIESIAVKKKEDFMNSYILPLNSTDWEIPLCQPVCSQNELAEKFFSLRESRWRAGTMARGGLEETL